MSAAVVGPDGVEVPAECDVTLDVSFDEQRVWSFHPVRDGRLEGSRRRTDWPAVLRPYLNGTARVSVREHVGSRVLYDEEMRFGTSDQRIRVVDAQGSPMTVSKWGKLERMLADRRAEVVDELVVALGRLLQTLHSQAGIQAFLAFGGLLGAVRTGHMIGHDTDGDVGYVSRYTHPMDVVLESYELERVVNKHGFATMRLSGGTFKVLVPTVERQGAGIDVFAGFYVDGAFHMMPGLSGELPLDAILPLSTVSLEGHRLPAPADPAALLEVTYGPEWRIPDPAFRFEHAERTKRRIDRWMRGERQHRPRWENFTAGAGKDARLDGPSPFAEWVAARGERADTVIDLGCGNGRDAFALARQGANVVALDYTDAARGHIRRGARRSGLPVTFQRMNLYDTRSVLTTGARLAHGLGHQSADLYARLLLNGLNDFGRDNFWVFTRLLLPLGGRVYLEFRTPQDRATRHEFRHWRRYLEPSQVIEKAREIGAVVEERREGRGLAPFGSEDPYVCQLVLKGR